jgi:Fe-S-cluster containining protein
MTTTIHYQCQRCTACCRWAGYVRVTEDEIPHIAAHLGIGLEDFIQRFTRLMPKRDGLALLEKPNGECVYLKEGACLLQDVKPSQCIGFPNTWNFPDWQETCKAIPVSKKVATKGARTRRKD